MRDRHPLAAAGFLAIALAALFVAYVVAGTPPAVNVTIDAPPEPETTSSFSSPFPTHSASSGQAWAAVVTIQTAVPPTATLRPTSPATLAPASSPTLVARCPTLDPGGACTWPNATSTPTPLPVCLTPVSNARCAWPTARPELATPQP